MPSDMIDRLTTETWLEGGSKNMLERAEEKVQTILKNHKPVPLLPETENTLDLTFRDILKCYEPQ